MNKICELLLIRKRYFWVQANGRFYSMAYAPLAP